MVVLGQIGGIRKKGWYPAKSVCIRAKVVVFGQNGYIKAKVVVFGQSGSIGAKVVVFGQKLL